VCIENVVKLNALYTYF